MLSAWHATPSPWTPSAQKSALFISTFVFNGAAWEAPSSNRADHKAANREEMSGVDGCLIRSHALAHSR